MRLKFSKYNTSTRWTVSICLGLSLSTEVEPKVICHYDRIANQGHQTVNYLRN